MEIQKIHKHGSEVHTREIKCIRKAILFAHGVSFFVATTCHPPAVQGAQQVGNIGANDFADLVHTFHGSLLRRVFLLSYFAFGWLEKLMSDFTSWLFCILGCREN